MMKSIQFITVHLLLLCAVYPKMEVSGMKCAGVKVDLTESQLNSIKECLTVVGVETVQDLGIENGGCFFKCILEKKGLIDANGGMHKEKLSEFVDSTMPDPAKAKVKKGLEECVDEEGEAKEIKMKGDDEMCSSFFPMALCFHQAFLTSC